MGGCLVAVKVQRNDMTVGCANEQERKQLLLGKVGVAFMPKPFFFAIWRLADFVTTFLSWRVHLPLWIVSLLRQGTIPWKSVDIGFKWPWKW